jgi:hypothetical protein
MSTYTLSPVRTSWAGHVHGVREIGPVDAWVVGLLLQHLVRLVSVTVEGFTMCNVMRWIVKMRREGK